MNLKKQIGLAVVITASLIACNSTDYKKTKEGFPYKVFSVGKGDTISPGNVVRYHLTNKIEDSLLGTTYGASAKWIPIAKEGEQNSMIKLLIGTRKGDSILVLQPVDSILKNNPGAAQDTFMLANKGKQLKTYIKVVEVYKDEALAQADFEKENISTFNAQPGVSTQRTKDNEILSAYLKTNNINAQQTPWGAYIQMVQPGSGPKPKLGQFVMLRYTGKDLTGKVFDSNNKPGAPLLPLQLGAGGAIVGFEDAVKQLSKGSKANVFIPSVIAYGPQGNPPVIQPNQSLIFELEVVDISDRQPQPTSPMTKGDSTGR